MNVNEPSAKCRQIFQAIEVEGRSIREVAQTAGLTTIEAVKMHAQARAWYHASAPDWAQESDPQARVLASCRLYDERLEFLFNEAMGAWQASRGEVTTRYQRDGDAHSAHSRTTVSQGQVRYLAMAARIAQMRIAAAQQIANFVEGLPPREPEVPPALPAPCTAPGRSCASYKGNSPFC